MLKEISELLNLDALTVGGNSLGANLESACIYKPEVIRSVDNPVSQKGGTAILYGNLAPNGAVIKPTAAEPRLLQHVGPAVVFKNHQDMMSRVDNEDLTVDENSVLVLQNAGPLGGPGMPEWGMLPIPKKLLQKGVRDMVRISDARMSGTSYGTCVLHVAPESFVGGPLAFVRDGDLIELDVPKRKLDLRVSDEELMRRRAQWSPEPPRYERGFGALYATAGTAIASVASNAKNVIRLMNSTPRLFAGGIVTDRGKVGEAMSETASRYRELRPAKSEENE